MRAGVNLVLAWFVLTAIANDAASDQNLEAQPGRTRWVPSFAITSGVTVQRQSALQSSTAFDGETDTESLLRPAKQDDDVAASPFVGGVLELMAPELPLPAGPRFFVSAEILPTFAPERQVQDGEPSRIRGPELNTVLAGEEDNLHFTTDPSKGPRLQQFGEESAKGAGMRTRFQVEQLMYGAKAGVAFAFQFRGRQMRIKPSIGWIHYSVEVKGALVNPTCLPSPRCTNTYFENGTLRQAGFLRETLLAAQDSRQFDAFGPGVDLEMDTGRFGPLGTAMFVGLHGYYLPGDREINVDASQTFDDLLSPSAAVDTNTASWQLRLAPWIYRAGVGIRFFWLGYPD